MKKQKIIILVSIISLFIMVQYFVIEKVLNENQKKLSEVYQSGYEQGFKDTVSTLFQETSDCKSTSIWIGNLSRQISDTECAEKLSP
jgi:hypothetical protein